MLSEGRTEEPTLVHYCSQSSQQTLHALIGQIFLGVSSHPKMSTTFEQDSGGQTSSYLDDDLDEVSSSSEHTDSDSFTSSVAKLLSTVDTPKTYNAADSARTYDKDITTSQCFQTRPASRVPLALQAVYLESCRHLEVVEPPPQAAVYLSQRVSLFAICLMSGVSASCTLCTQSHPLNLFTCSHLPSSTWTTHSRSVAIQQNDSKPSTLGTTENQHRYSSQAMTYTCSK